MISPAYLSSLRKLALLGAQLGLPASKVIRCALDQMYMRQVE
jgi:hypothetical protein